MSDINFTSCIVPVTAAEFTSISGRIGDAYHAKYPWTIGASVISTDVFTRGICDCTACLISDGRKALLMHLNPENPQNHCFCYIREFLRNKFNLNSPDLQAFIVGSKNTKKSLDIYNNLLSIMREAGIQTSILKMSKSPVHIAYRSQTDAIYVSSCDITKGIMNKKSHSDILNSSFEKVVISPLDEIG